MVGSFLYDACALNITMLPVLNQIASQGGQPTQHIIRNQCLIDYNKIYFNAYLRFYTSDMQLLVDSDAAHIVPPKPRIRISGYFRLISTPTNKR